MPGTLGIARCDDNCRLEASGCCRVDQWTIDRVFAAGHVGATIQLALDGAEQPHISFYGSAEEWPAGTLMYARRDQGQWFAVEVDPDRTGIGIQHSLALDGDGSPHISFAVDGTGSQSLEYARLKQGDWELEIVDSDYHCGWWNSLALDSAGRPHITYTAARISDPMYYSELRYARRVGAVWIIETLPCETGVGHTALALDDADLAHVAYTCNGLVYAHQEGDIWHYENVDASGSYQTLRIDRLGRPHLAYLSGHPDNELRYAVRDAGSWQIQTVDSVGGGPSTGGYRPGLAFDSRGRAHLIYITGFSTQSMHHAQWDGSNWQIQELPVGQVYEKHSLVMDRDDHPHLAFWSHHVTYATLSCR